VSTAWEVVKALLARRLLTLNDLMLSPDGEEAGVWLQWSNLGLFCVVQSNGEIVVETVRPTLSSTPVGSPDDAARLLAKLLLAQDRIRR
jgi:hypothetical protein